MTRVTAADLRRLTPHGDSSLLAGLAPLLGEILPSYGITTSLRLAHFLAQAAHETDGFKTLVEYGGVDYFNKRYGPQTDVGKELGNIQAGDGARFRGRGVFQCTGRFNYAKYGKLIGVDLVANPKQAATVPNSVRIACEYWKAKGLNALADADNIEAITRKINVGLNGLKDRRTYLAKATAIFGTAPAGLCTRAASDAACRPPRRADRHPGAQPSREVRDGDQRRHNGGRLGRRRPARCDPEPLCPDRLSRRGCRCRRSDLARYEAQRAGLMCTWFLTTKPGRYLAAGGALAFILAGFALKLLTIGRAQEKAAQAHKNEAAAQDRKDLENEIDALGPADLDRRASRWLSDKRQW